MEGMPFKTDPCQLAFNFFAGMTQAARLQYGKIPQIYYARWTLDLLEDSRRRTTNRRAYQLVWQFSHTRESRLEAVTLLDATKVDEICPYVKRSWHHITSMPNIFFTLHNQPRSEDLHLRFWGPGKEVDYIITH